MPANAPTITFDRLYSTTAAIHRPQLAMEIVRSNVLLWHMYRQGAVTYSGGTEVRMPVVLEESANVGSIGLYSTFSTSPEDGPDIARYPTWFKIRSSTVFDETELGQNQGQQQILDLLKTKMAISKISMINEIERQLWASSKTALELTGLQSAASGDAAMFQFSSTFTAGDTVGGIDKSVYSNWQEQYQSMTAFGTDGLDQWERVYMDCSKKGTHPDIMLCDPAVYRFFKRLVAPNQERKDIKLWEQGFDNLVFNHCAVVPVDELESAGAGQTYFLTTTGRRQVNDFNLKAEYFKTPGKNPAVKGAATGIGLQLAVLRKDDFRMTPFRYPPDSDTLLAHCFFTSMLTNSSQARQGCTDFSGTVQF